MSRSRSRSPGGYRGGGGGDRPRFGQGGRPPHSDDLHSVQLDGLPEDVRADDLRADFEKFGKVGDVFLPKDRDTGRTRGFGFVRFYEKRDMEDCLDEMRDGFEMDGKKIEVQFAKPRPRPGRQGWNPDRRDGGGRGGGYGGGRDRNGGGGYGGRGGGGGYGGGRDRNGGGYGRDRSPPQRRRSRSRSYERRRSPPPRDNDRYDRRRSRSRTPPRRERY